MSAPAYIANAAGYETPPALIWAPPALRWPVVSSALSKPTRKATIAFLGPNLRVLEPLRNPCPASSWDGARPQAGILRAKGIDTQWGWHAEGGWHAKGGMLQGGMLRGRLSWGGMLAGRTHNKDGVA